MAEARAAQYRELDEEELAVVARSLKGDGGNGRSAYYRKPGEGEAAALVAAAGARETWRALKPTLPPRHSLSDPFFTAAADGDVQGWRRLVKMATDERPGNSSGNSSDDGDSNSNSEYALPPAVKLLRCRDADDRTPVHWAAAGGHKAVLQAMLGGARDALDDALLGDLRKLQRRLRGFVEKTWESHRPPALEDVGDQHYYSARGRRDRRERYAIIERELAG